VPGEAEEHVLDVGGGTGHLARAYATVVALAVVVDLTPEMLAVGKANCDVHGQRNVLFVCANAASLPFLAEGFDLVVSRLAVHHFERPMLQIAEMARVCRPGGRVGIIDLIAAEPALCAAQDRLERMRDPSHTRALPLGELTGLIEDAGLEATVRAERDRPVLIERWLSLTSTPADIGEAIRAELTAELDGGAPTGMRPHLRHGELYQTQRWAIVVGQKHA